jgi:hypothetical protein
MASRKHQKQDSTRPTKARERRLSDRFAPLTEELEVERPLVNAAGGGVSG